MYKINILNVDNLYDYNELIKIFLNPKDYVVNDPEIVDFDIEITINEDNSTDKHKIKKEIYEKLASATGLRPQWGTLTGVRPVKLAGEIYDQCLDKAKTIETLKDRFLLSDQKAQLIVDTYLRQQKVFGKPQENSAGLYIGIPFCPTRCSYCSFASNQVKDSEIERYLQALLKEIQYVGKKIRENNVLIESIYIGGGTPTTLSADQLETLLSTIEENIDLQNNKEFTVEAGRPDTITLEKLQVIKDHGIKRISINPQTMKDHTLELIGRKHSSQAIFEAFDMAHQVGIEEINADIIAGLPEETAEDFKSTLETVISLEPKNITVHTLAVKRASRLHEEDEDYHYRQGRLVEEMLKISRQMLGEKGFIPYYLYRQKHMAGAFENIGYSINDTDCLYNVRIMEEKQSIIALGAGGISKAYYPEENRHERVPNVTNYEIYIQRLDEMIERKENNLFRR